MMAKPDVVKKKKKKKMPDGLDDQKKFIASPTFGGPRDGFVFTTRAKGTGYYADGDKKTKTKKRKEEEKEEEAPPVETDGDKKKTKKKKQRKEEEEEETAPRVEVAPEAPEEEKEVPKGKAAWTGLGLHDALGQACEELKWLTPTTIQREAIPVALKGQDVIGLAETGSGKTGAFALPILHRLLEKPRRLYGVVLAPTRELALQIHEVFQALGTGIGLRAACVVGGVDQVQQALALAKFPHVVIATPGRLVDHLQNTKGFSLKQTRCLVLDEADRMLSMDFEKEITAVLEALPKDQERLSMLFSATMTSKVAKLQRASLRNPKKISVNDKFGTPKQLIQEYLFIPAKFKEAYLVYVLFQYLTAATLVFVSTCSGATKLTLALRHLGLKATCLHGQMSQPKRLNALNKFKAQEEGSVLIATDVASRGLDIPSVDLVVNYDIPAHGKEYVHRVGRTARAGQKGRAIAFVTQYDIELYQRLEHLIGTKLPAYPRVDEADVLKHLSKVNDAFRLAAIELKDLQDNLSGGRKKKKRKLGDLDDDDDDGDEEDALLYKQQTAIFDAEPKSVQAHLRKKGKKKHSSGGKHSKGVSNKRSNPFSR